MIESLEARFKAAIETGQFDDFGLLYASTATLTARLAGRDLAIDGSDQIVRELNGWWSEPGRVDRWDAATSDGGLRVMLERSWGNGATDREGQFHLLHVRRGRIAEHWVFCVHARYGPPPVIDGPVPSFLRDARERTPLPHAGDSGSYLERVLLADGRTAIVKHISPSVDWIMRATHDTGREAELWEAGHLQELSSIDVPTFGVEREGHDGWAIAMRDVSETLVADRSPVGREENRRFLEAADALHRQFDGRVLPGLCSLADRLFMFSPGVALTEHGRSFLMPKILGRAWELFPEVVGDDDVASIMLGLLDDPAPLITELAREGATLLHGDYYDSNLGLTDDRVVAFDWAMACSGPPEVEFLYFLHNWANTPVEQRADLIADWRAIRGDDFDQRRFQLATLYQVLLCGWSWSQKVWATNPVVRQRLEADMAWWLAEVRAALEMWSP